MENLDTSIALAVSVKVAIPILLGMPVLVTVADYVDHGRESGRGWPVCVTAGLSLLAALLIILPAIVFFDLTFNPITAKSGWPVLYVFVAIPWAYLVVLRRRRRKSAVEPL